MDQAHSFLSSDSLSRRLPADSATIALRSIASLSGRLVEVSGLGGNAGLSIAMQWVRATQVQKELAAWVQLGPSVPFIPDVVALGIDLKALPFVIMPTLVSVMRSAEHLLRSGAFGLVVVDLGCSIGPIKQKDPQLPMAALSRILGLAQKHHTAVVCLSEKSRESPSLGSLVSLRIHCGRSGAQVRAEVVKDKHAGPGRQAAWSFASVPGVR